MRAIAALPALTVGFALIASAASAQITVRVDQVRRLSFPGTAADVVVGNPDIADVTVVDGRNVFVTGRAAGSTDVVVLDAAGRTLMNDSVRVGRVGDTGDGPQVSVARGTVMTTVSCSPRCADTTSAASSGAAAAAPARAQIQAPSAAPAASVADVANQTAPAGATASATVG